MDLRHLRYFLAVVDEGSVTAADARLFISQPALSRAVRHLERQLRTQLLVRTSRGIGLTAAGEDLATSARFLVEEADRSSDSRGPGSADTRGGPPVSP